MNRKAPPPSNPSEAPSLRPAATVLLVRDGVAGIEVFLMKRSGFGMFGGLHVFPGGKVDGADHAARWSRLADGPDDATASRILGLPQGGLGYWVACIRECFEEAGVLLATDGAGRPLRLAAPDARARYETWRGRLNSGESGVLEAMCTTEGLRLATDQLAYVSHWITPLGQPTRFNTRFFVARAPTGQDALHDGHETVQSEWIRPAVALERFAAGELDLISPTFKNLEAIAGFTSTETLLDAKRRVDPSTIPTILPRILSFSEKGLEEVLEVVGYGGKARAR
ncbi:MAG: NUDIX hydrolase [Deltaproteobacteria bacterium]|nr:NUDIX hydrolase [Deltaproteobacteria bacterium]